MMGWIDGYITRRYGNWTQETHDAWQLLLDAAYRFQWSWSLRSIASHGPSLSLSSDTRLNPGKIAAAWKLILTAINENKLNSSIGPLRYDVVDIGRQFLMNLFADVYKLYVSTVQFYVKNKDATSLVAQVTHLENTLVDILTDLDNMLATDINFLLGNWLLDAWKSAPDNASTDVVSLILFNARNQITMWGPDENIEDYAGKDWAGLVGTYYIGRWKIFFESVSEYVTKGTFNTTQYGEKRLKFEQNWDNEQTSFPSTPTGETIEITNTILKKYFLDDEEVSAHYTVKIDRDVEGSELYGEPVALWNNATEQIMWLCDMNPDCAGFALPNLSFKSSVAGDKVSPGSLLFVKNK